MGVVLTLCFAMIAWIVIWAIGGSGFDGFLLALLIMMIAAGVKIIMPFLPGNRPERD